MKGQVHVLKCTAHFPQSTLPYTRCGHSCGGICSENSKDCSSGFFAFQLITYVQTKAYIWPGVIPSSWCDITVSSFQHDWCCLVTLCVFLIARFTHLRVDSTVFPLHLMSSPSSHFVLLPCYADRVLIT